MRNYTFLIFILSKRTLLIGAEGGEDSCGSTGQGRPRRRQSAEEAPRHALWCAKPPGAEINSQFRHTIQNLRDFFSALKFFA